MRHAQIRHLSLYAHDPEGAAAHLAALVQGFAAPFHACEGGWVCFFDKQDDWTGPFVELYPRDMSLAAGEGGVTFVAIEPPARGAGGHVNLAVDASRDALEAICHARGLRHMWRDWAALLDVWLDEELLVECVPVATSSDP